MSPEIDPQTQTMINSMPERTGNSLEGWYQLLKDANALQHGEIMKILKGEYGVSHGYANTISILYRQFLEGGPASDDDLVAAQYSEAKAALRPVYEAVITTVSGFGPDVEVAPKKTYVSLRRNKQFAIVQAATRTRVDLGLNLPGYEPTERLEGGNVFGGMCTHRVRLTSAAELDGEVRDWLKLAYEAS